MHKYFSSRRHLDCERRLLSFAEVPDHKPVSATDGLEHKLTSDQRIDRLETQLEAQLKQNEKLMETNKKLAENLEGLQKMLKEKIENTDKALKSPAAPLAFGNGNVLPNQINGSPFLTVQRAQNVAQMASLYNGYPHIAYPRPYAQNGVPVQPQPPVEQLPPPPAVVVEAPVRRPRSFYDKKSRTLFNYNPETNTYVAHSVDKARQNIDRQNALQRELDQMKRERSIAQGRFIQSWRSNGPSVEHQLNTERTAWNELGMKPQEMYQRPSAAPDKWFAAHYPARAQTRIGTDAPMLYGTRFDLPKSQPIPSVEIRVAPQGNPALEQALSAEKAKFNMIPADLQWHTIETGKAGFEYAKGGDGYMYAHETKTGNVSRYDHFTNRWEAIDYTRAKNAGLKVTEEMQKKLGEAHKRIAERQVKLPQPAEKQFTDSPERSEVQRTIGTPDWFKPSYEGNEKFIKAGAVVKAGDPWPSMPTKFIDGVYTVPSPNTLPDEDPLPFVNYSGWHMPPGRFDLNHLTPQEQKRTIERLKNPYTNAEETLKLRKYHRANGITRKETPAVQEPILTPVPPVDAPLPVPKPAPKPVAPVPPSDTMDTRVPSPVDEPPVSAADAIPDKTPAKPATPTQEKPKKPGFWESLMGAPMTSDSVQPAPATPEPPPAKKPAKSAGQPVEKPVENKETKKGRSIDNPFEEEPQAIPPAPTTPKSAPADKPAKPTDKPIEKPAEAKENKGDKKIENPFDDL
jgi:hypothetical protein